MTIMERALREAVVKEALTWLGTPYHHQGTLKGKGVDCAFLLIKVFQACGLVPTDIDPRPYPRDWHLHRSAERYLGWITRYAGPVSTPGPGDLVTFKYGRCISHGAIVIEWPTIVHAVAQARAVILDNAAQEPLAGRVAGIYSYWAEKGVVVT
jgi:cell wall-associated NlpC family hydrolase